MDINKFIEKRPFLYHLTSLENSQKILRRGEILSTNAIIDHSGIDSLQHLKRIKRLTHTEIQMGSEVISLRDQKPISLLSLSKCLENSWGTSDFIEFLNDRVFMWPTVERLRRHYNTYASESPVILRFDTAATLELNPHFKFCRLNSGATRANSYLGGIPPMRGQSTFLPPSEFLLPISQVAEVTFENACRLPHNVSQSDVPDGPFRRHS